MDHVAIDLGGRKSQICARRSSGEIFAEVAVPTAALEEWLAKLPKSRVIMETCAESIAISRYARQSGHDVRVVPATLVRSLGVGARRIKTDIRDARALSEASCRMELRGVHMRSNLARQRQIALGMRAGLVSARTLLINTVKGWLRTEVQSIGKHTAATFPEAVEDKFGEALPACVASQLVAIRALTEQIKTADKTLVSVAKADDIIARLMTVPGIGPTTATCFAAVVDTPERFPNTKALCSYLGLTPGESSSSDTVRRTGITKAGPPMLRQLLVQCAWTVWNHKTNTPLAQWASAIADRRGKRVAVVALARKLAAVMFAIWRDGTPYRFALTIREAAM